MRSVLCHHSGRRRRSLSDKGTWSISSNKLNVDTLDGTVNEAVRLADPDLDICNYAVEVTFPTGSSTNKAGIVFLHDGNDSYYVVILWRAKNTVQLHKVTSGSWGAKLASMSATIPEIVPVTLG